MAPFVIRNRLVLLTALVCATMCRPAVGCGVCVLISDPFRMPHPHAVRIAMATREAMESGTLCKADSEGPAEFEANLARLTSQLAYPKSVMESVVIDILVVDESALYRVEVQGMRSRVSRVTDKHRPASARFVTTVPVVNAVGRLEIRIAEVLRKGLLEIEAIPSAQPSEVAGD